MTVRYFKRPIMGTPHTRYFILAGAHTVVGVQISRPDGVEVPEPAHLRFARPRIEPAPVRRPNINPPVTLVKSCSRCKEERPRVEFTTYTGSNRLKSWCKSCINEHRRHKRETEDESFAMA